MRRASPNKKGVPAFEPRARKKRFDAKRPEPLEIQEFPQFLPQIVTNPPETPQIVENAHSVPQFTEHEILAALCRRSLAKFVREFWHLVSAEKLLWNWHIQYLCDEFQEVAERVFLGLAKKHDVIANISPGTSKSTVASIMLPAWMWTRMPSARIITASYRYDLATDLSRKSRDIVRSELYRACFPGIEIRDDQDAKGFYVNTHGGERYAIGKDGGVMGKHAHLIVVDDPLDPKQAASAADLKSTNDWMEETLPSRKVDKLVTPTILIMQRLDQFDPTGSRLEKADKLPVHHICIPAELTADVKPKALRKNYVDGLMDPVRLSYQALADAEAQGRFVFASQFLQTPIPRGGAMFDVSMLRVRTPPEKFKTLIRGWDKAATAMGGAFTVGTLMGLDFDNHFWVLDVVRNQWNSGDREKVIASTAARDGKRVMIIVEEEPGGGGKESAQGTIRNLAGYRVRAYKVGKSDGDKEARADSFSAQVNNGNVSLAPGAWNKEFIAELQFFPKSKFKDQVDSASLSFNCVAVRKRVLGTAASLTAKH